VPETSTTEETREQQALAGNEGFNDMVVREAEAMILHASLDDLITFAYGSWPAAQEAWKQKQRASFPRSRRGRPLLRALE
jgi:hypothetical protein